MINISLKFAPKGPINKIPALVEIMAWRHWGNKPLSEPAVVSLPMYICITRPQWAKKCKYIKKLHILYVSCRSCIMRPVLRYVSYRGSTVSFHPYNLLWVNNPDCNYPKASCGDNFLKKIVHTALSYLIILYHLLVSLLIRYIYFEPSTEIIRVWFNTEFVYLQNSVRHNLSLNKCFEKMENPRSNGNTKKGCLWAMNPEKIEKMEEEIAKWRKKDPLAIKRSMAKPGTTGWSLGSMDLP